VCYIIDFPVVSRRKFLSNLGLIAGAPFINRGRYSLFAGSLEEYSSLAIELVQTSTVIDMLGLITLDFPKLFAWQQKPSLFGSADFEKIKAGGITIFHTATGYCTGNIHQLSLADIQGWNRLIEARPEYFTRVNKASDFDAVKASGKIGILIGQQNSAHFRTLEDVDAFYQIGQRVSQLTYYDNRLGGGSTDPRDRGLTAYGGEVVARMNRLGMAVDVSHCGDRTTMDAIDASKHPVLVTHSNCRALNPGTARCKTDEAIRHLAEKGGVMGLTMIRFFVGAGVGGGAAVTMENVLDHVDHIAEIAGVEHVGLGTDRDLDGFDGKSNLDGVHYSKKVFDLTQGLLRRKYSRADIELILGKNFGRALQAIWNS
jgi:membrane dipeptidase